MFLNRCKHGINNLETSALREAGNRSKLVMNFRHFFFFSMLGGCRQLHFPLSLQKTDRRLIGHNITIKLVRDIDECDWHCYQHPCCVSVNFRTTANTEKRHRCELNNATYKKYVEDLAESNGFIYRGTEVSGKVINI